MFPHNVVRRAINRTLPYQELPLSAVAFQLEILQEKDISPFVKIFIIVFPKLGTMGVQSDTAIPGLAFKRRRSAARNPEK